MDMSLGETKKEKFRELLKEYGVTKCYVSPGFDFGADSPDGDIFVDVNSYELVMKIYKLFTKDVNGFVEEDQFLGVSFRDPDRLKENFKIRG